jgi:hypothetical protein
MMVPTPRASGGVATRSSRFTRRRSRRTRLADRLVTCVKNLSRTASKLAIYRSAVSAVGASKEKVFSHTNAYGASADGRLLHP